MKKLLVIIVILIVGGVIADSALRSWASNKVAGEMRSALNLTEEPQIAIGGFPFLWEAITGRLESVKVTAAGLERSGVSLTDVEVTLEDVRISLPKLISGEAKKVRIGSAHGVAHLASADLASALGQPGLDLSVVDPSIVTIDGTTLSVGSTSMELPALVDGVDYTEARLNGDVIELRFVAGNTTLKIAAQAQTMGVFAL
jgi:hypothetical protein